MVSKEDDIERYRKGQLSPKERNALERKALSDPFLEDALEGSHSISSEKFSMDLKALSKRIKEDSSKSWLKPLRMAAAVLILVGAGSLFFWIDLSEPATMALEKRSPVKTDSAQDKKANDSSISLSSLKKTEPAPTNNDLSQRSPVKKVKPFRKKEPAPPIDLSTATDASWKTAGAEIAQEGQAPVVVEEIKVAELPRVEEGPTVAMQEEAKKDRENVSLSNMKKGATESKGESLRSGFVATPQIVSGQVISTEDGSPLPGVNVLVKGTTNGTVTDSNGNFQLSIDIANPQLAFSFIGMHTVEAKPTQDVALNIEMKEDASQLSEVVVTGYGTSSDDRDKEPVIKSAYPVGGLRAYNKYLEDNLRYPAEALNSDIKGKVTVEFTIAINGNISEFNILKGLGHGCDDEVIRLVKEGPKWNPTMVDNVSVETQVRVKMKFDPNKAKK